MSESALFSGTSLSDVLFATTKSIPELVNKAPKDRFLVSMDEELVEHFVSELAVEPLQIYEGRMERTEFRETQMDVSGRFDYDPFPEDRRGPLLTHANEVTVTIPFTGEAGLWKLRPNPLRMSFPRAVVVPGRGEEPGMLKFSIIKLHDADEGEFGDDLEKRLDDVRTHIENQRKQVEAFNKQLPSAILDAVKKRRERLEKQEGLAKALDIPVKERSGSQPIEPIKVKEKIVKPLPPPPKSGFKPEPGIEEKNYENILKIIRHQGRTFETTPATYKVHDEEELRDIILANLNIYLEGGAGGELFRKSGKTDMCVKEGDRAAFVAECTVWYGEKKLLGKVDQLISYLTWRDAKAALVIFNKKIGKFSELLEKVPVALAKHPSSVKDHGQQGDGEWRYMFRSTEDEGRRITVHVFLFDLFVK